MSVRRLGALLAGLLLTTLPAHSATMKNDPKRPVAAISRDLGVSEAQFVNCFSGVSPTPGGGRPESHQRVQSNKRVLLSCLKQHNPKITNDALDRVMDRYRPGGREAQRPMS